MPSKKMETQESGKGKKEREDSVSCRSDDSSESRSRSRNCGIRRWRRQNASFSSIRSWSAGRYGSPGRVYVEDPNTPPPSCSSSGSSIQPYYPIRPGRMEYEEVTPDTKPPTHRHASTSKARASPQQLSSSKQAHCSSRSQQQQHRSRQPQPGTSRQQGNTRHQKTGRVPAHSRHHQPYRRSGNRHRASRRNRH